MKSKTGPLTISACMMVKDEEDHITRCLNSIREFVDEIVIVDTGSTDKTLDIIKTLTFQGFPIKLYHHPWENDFSKHRNQSLGYATSKWSFIIDADEELIIEDGIRFKKNLSNLPLTHNGVAVVLKDIQQTSQVLEFNTVRFFRAEKVQYEGIVHNAPKIEGGKGAVFVPGVYVNHYGYDMNPEQREKKTLRTESLLLKRLEIDPKDYHAIFYLNQLHAANGNFSKSIPYGEEYIKHKEELEKSGIGNFNRSIYHTMIKSYIKLETEQGLQKANDWIQMGIKEMPEDLDLSLCLVEYGIKVGQPDVIMLGGKKFVNLYNGYIQDPSKKENRFIYSSNPNALAFVLFNLTQAYLMELQMSVTSIKEVLETLVPKMKDGMTADLKRMCTAFGFFPEKISNEIKARVIKEENNEESLAVSDPNFLNQLKV